MTIAGVEREKEKEYSRWRIFDYRGRTVAKFYGFAGEAISQMRTIAWAINRLEDRADVAK